MKKNRKTFIKQNMGGMFKSCLAGLALTMAGGLTSAHAVGELEKDELKFGFIKLTDMAPLAVAYEKGFFEDTSPLNHRRTGRYCWIV